jgi:outer membrane protein assembly factor BamB
VTAFDAKTGVVLWTFTAASRYAAKIAVAGGTVYFGDHTGVRAVRPSG